MTKMIPKRKNDFAVAPHATDIMPPHSNVSKTNSVDPHATNIVPTEQQAQEYDD